MNKSVKMAKVITMKALMHDGRMILTVSTVDPIVTPTMMKTMYGIPGQIINSEETEVMPLPFALYHASRQRDALGIQHYTRFVS